MEISSSNPDLVQTTALDCSSEDAVHSFFASVPQNSFHHMVVTLGDSVDCADIRGTEGLSGLRNQFNQKFFAQVTPVSLGVDKMADGGCVVFTTGALSKRPGKGNTALASANAVLESVCKGLANDLGPRVRVNCVSPGLTNTEMWHSLPAAAREGMLKGFGSKLAMGRAGESSDVGNAIAFLLTAQYITGTTLDVDGGAAIRV